MDNPNPLSYRSTKPNIQTNEDVVLNGVVIGEVRGRLGDKDSPYHAALHLSSSGVRIVDGLDLAQGFGATREDAVAEAIASALLHAESVRKAAEILGDQIRMPAQAVTREERS